MSRTLGGENQRAARVAVFLPTLGGGGVERVLLMLAEGFVQRGLSVDLLLARAEGPFLESVPGEVRLVDFDSRMTVTSLPKLLRYLRRERPDALVAASNAVIPALIARRYFTPKTPTLARQDNTHTMQARTANLKMRMALRLIRYLLPSADAVIAVSSGVAEDLGRTVPGAAGLVRVVPNPVIDDDLDDRAAEPTGHPWLSGPGVPVILSAGRLVPQKDHPTLLRAFAEVVSNHVLRVSSFWGRARTGSEADGACPGAWNSRSRGFPGVCRQSVRVHVEGERVRAVVRDGGAPDGADRSDGVRGAGGQHRLPQRARRDTGGRQVGPARGLWETGERWRKPSRTPWTALRRQTS